jgi:hypothetical protein
MPLTFLTIKTSLRERLGDDGSVDWTDAQLANAVQDAMRVAWPYFFEVVADETTYAGANFRDVNVTEVAVPATFYSATGIGKITRLEWRPYVGTGVTNYYQWLPLKRGVYLDDLQLTSPKIRFSATRGRQFELKITGLRPLTLPAVNGDNVAGTDWPGFVVWLYFAAEKFARAARQRAAQYDPEAETQRRVMATQEMTDLAKTYRMRPAGQTIFSRW